MNNKGLYTEDSIESLSPLEFTRLRAGVYAGSTEYSTQLLIEIVSNSIDEWRLGHGDTIDININNNVCSVRDYGQGFLINSLRPDGKTVLQACFDTLNTSGKFNNDGVYEGTALGLNGIGAKLSNFLSHWLTVVSYRDGQSEKITFKEGVFNNREIKKTSAPSGVYVEWLPSEEFFTNVEIEKSKIENLFKTLTCLCKGLTINFNYEGRKTSFYSKNGITDLVDSYVKDNELIDNRLNIDYAEGKNKLDLSMTYTTNYSSNIIAYVNTGETDSGPHITQLKTIITRELNKFFRNKKWLKEKEENLSGDDLQEGMLLVFNITAPNVSYDAQTKSRIVKIDMTPFTTIFSDSLSSWLENNEKIAKVIADKALTARRAREAARKAKENARKPKEKGLKAKMALSDKFIDCSSKNPNERKLFILEGVSAGSAAIEARNPKTDSIYLLRGKIISPLRTEVNKILANQEMSDLINIIGAGFGKDFDINKINFDKIIIFSDSDAK